MNYLGGNKGQVFIACLSRRVCVYEFSEL